MEEFDANEFMKQHRGLQVLLIVGFVGLLLGLLGRRIFPTIATYVLIGAVVMLVIYVIAISLALKKAKGSGKQ